MSDPPNSRTADAWEQIYRDASSELSGLEAELDKVQGKRRGLRRGDNAGHSEPDTEIEELDRRRGVEVARREQARRASELIRGGAEVLSAPTESASWRLEWRQDGVGDRIEGYRDRLLAEDEIEERRQREARDVQRFSALREKEYSAALLDHRIDESRRILADPDADELDRKAAKYYLDRNLPRK